MDILIVGAGAQGAPCAAVLAKQPGVNRILLGASKLEAATSVLDPQIQAQLVPLIADTKAHILIKGTVGGQEKTFHIASSAFLDEAATALELFGSANVSLGYAAATAALLLAEGKTKPGIVWPEELDPVRFITLTNTLALTLNFTVR